MEFSEHRCRNCGGQLSQQEDKRWRCPYCSSVFEDSSTAKHSENMSKMFDDAKKEIVNNLRRNLYDATHAEYISSAEIHTACTAIKQYLPEDFQANFYEVAAGNNVKQLTKVIRKIDIEENIDDIEGIIQFLIRSLQTEYLLELNNLIERTYKNRDLKKYEDYATQLSVEAEKVNLGVYETKFPRQAFIAYSSKDMDKVSELVDILEAQGMKCFVAARNLRHGKGAVENYNKALEEAMDHCQSFVFVSTPNSRSMNCDALSIELPYIQSKDIENSPAEYRNNYKSIPTRYKKPRVEYRIGDMTGNNAADAITGEFFDGYEWVYSPDEVAQRIMKQLIATPQSEPVQVKYMDMEQKKICSSCGSENPINTKFCGECGGNDFVNSVSAFIKLRKMQEAAEKAKNEAALAEAEKAAKEALAEAEKAKKDAEAKAAKAAATEQAKKDAEAKAKAAEEAKKAEALKNAGTSSSYSSSSYSSSSSRSSKSSSKFPLGCLIPIIALVAIALVLTIISTVMNNNDEQVTDSVTEEVIVPDNNNNGNSNSNDNNNSSGNASNYPYLSFTEVGSGLSVSANPDKLDEITGELVIPSEINGSKVVEIAEKGFEGCAYLTSVTVPDTVKTIGHAAFSGCSGIKEITLPFVGAKDLAEGSGALFGYIFGTESYAAANPTKQYYDSWNSSTYYLPPQLTKVTITNATQLGYGAFYNCNTLSEINLNDDISTVGVSAFYYCSAIEEINLPSLTAISDYMLEGCSSLKSFEIGKNVVSIGTYAFKGCSSLSRINSSEEGSFVIDNHVKTINLGAFSGCSSVNSITLPFVGQTASAVNSGALFGYIFGTESYAAANPTKQYYDSWNSSTYYLPPQLTKVTITNATQLGYGAFYDCDTLSEINLNDGIITAGVSAFYCCSAIEEINLPNLTAISDYMLEGCSALKSFEIGENVVSIGTYAFKGCISLLRINSSKEGSFVIDNHVKTINLGAFSGCSNVNSITLPYVGKTVSSSYSEAMFGYIFGREEYANGYSAKQYYDSWNSNTNYIPVQLSNVTITNATQLYRGAFMDCKYITNIQINTAASSSVGESVFDNCPATVIYQDYVPEEETEEGTGDETETGDIGTGVGETDTTETDTTDTNEPTTATYTVEMMIADSDSEIPPVGSRVVLRTDPFGEDIAEAYVTSDGFAIFENVEIGNYYAVFVDTGDYSEFDENYYSYMLVHC